MEIKGNMIKIILIEVIEHKGEMIKNRAAHINNLKETNQIVLEVLKERNQEIKRMKEHIVS